MVLFNSYVTVPENIHKPIHRAPKRSAGRLPPGAYGEDATPEHLIGHTRDVHDVGHQGAQGLPY